MWSLAGWSFELKKFHCRLSILKLDPNNIDSLTFVNEGSYEMIFKQTWWSNEVSQSTAIYETITEQNKSSKIYHWSTRITAIHSILIPAFS